MSQRFWGCMRSKTDPFYLSSVARMTARFDFLLGHDELLYWKGAHGLRLYLPASMRESLLFEAHDTTSGGHFGMDKLFESLSRRFYWPSMRAHVRRYVATCVSCQRNKSVQKKSAGLLSSNPIPDVPWAHVTLDFITGMPVSEGFDSILTVVDRLSQMAYFILCHEPTTAGDTAKRLVQHVVRLHGLPLCYTVIRTTDLLVNCGTLGGSYWAAGSTCLLHDTLRLIMSLSMSLSRPIGSLKSCWGISFEPSMTDWVGHLPYWSFDYNSYVHTSTGVTPFLMIYGYYPRSM